MLCGFRCGAQVTRDQLLLTKYKSLPGMCVVLHARHPHPALSLHEASDGGAANILAAQCKIQQVLASYRITLAILLATEDVASRHTRTRYHGYRCTQIRRLRYCRRCWGWGGTDGNIRAAVAIGRTSLQTAALIAHRGRGW